MHESIRIDASMIVAFKDGGHRILHDGCIVLRGNEIVYVGKDYDGHVDRVIDKKGSLVSPGFINVHTHIGGSPLDRSFIEDVGKRQFSLSGLVEMLPARSAAQDYLATQACVDFSMVELIRTGTTTFMDMGESGEYIADAAERSGLRAYIADGYRSGNWYTPDGKAVQYAWDEEKGFRDMDASIELIEKLAGRANGRIQGFLSPWQVDTSTQELLVRSRDAAIDLGVPIALHVSQSVFEFDEMVRRHGLTPIEWLESIGFLNDKCILGHAIMPAGHSWVQFAGDDLAILADTGASVAHCPWVFARRGLAMENFADYIAKGVNMCIGTDTAPQSMIDEIQWAAVVGKIEKRQTEKSTARDVFEAATLNAARMLKRDDLGRISPGAKADLLIWDMNSLFMSPVRDPIRNIVYNATAEDLHEVVIDGNWVMKDRQVLHYDEAEVCSNLQAAAQRTWQKIGSGHWAKETVDIISPLTYPDF